jgi:hypothetical protein
LPFGRWGETFPDDDDVAAAMIDRLVHHAEVLTLTGDSYRTRADVNCSQRTARTAERLLRAEFAVAATTSAIMPRLLPTPSESGMQVCGASGDDSVNSRQVVWRFLQVGGEEKFDSLPGVLR